MRGYDSWKTRSDLDDWAAQNHEPPEELEESLVERCAAALWNEREKRFPPEAQVPWDHVEDGEGGSARDEVRDETRAVLFAALSEMTVNAAMAEERDAANVAYEAMQSQRDAARAALTAAVEAERAACEAIALAKQWALLSGRDTAAGIADAIAARKAKP